MDIPSSANEQTIPVDKPYERNIWVSVILTFFGAGLPLIYCGNFVGGIVLSLLRAIILFPFFFFALTAYSFKTMFIVIVINFIILAAIFVYNIRYTKKTNNARKPRTKNVWVCIVIFGITSFGFECFSTHSIKTILKTSIFRPYEFMIYGMENTILQGDDLLATKGVNTNNLRRGELAIFKEPNFESMSCLSRIVAIGGDTIEIINKHLIINHRAIPLPPGAQYLDTLPPRPYGMGRIDDKGFGPGIRDNMPEYVVPEGKFFVLGDNRDSTLDSRYWGPVERDEIIGRPRFILLSWDGNKWYPRWNRIGKRLDDHVQ